MDQSTKTNITPTIGFVLVKRLDKRRMGNVIMPGSQEDSGVESVVIHARGTKVFLDPGDIVYTSRFVGVPFDTDGTVEGQVHLIKEEDILGYTMKGTGE